MIEDEVTKLAAIIKDYSAAVKHKEDNLAKDKFILTTLVNRLHELKISYVAPKPKTTKVEIDDAMKGVAKKKVVKKPTVQTTKK